jgi:DNA-binding transcriptional MerR regulator
VFGIVEDPNAPVARSVPKMAYTLSETAQALNLSTVTVRRLHRRKLLRNVKAVRHLRFTVREIERFLVETSKEVS